MAEHQSWHSEAMGKLADLKTEVAAKLSANVTELADVDVIAHRGRDVAQQVQLAISKMSGLAVVVALTSGEDNQSESRIVGMDLRLTSTLSITIWSVPIHAKNASVSAPLTSGAREPDDVLEAVAKYLHNLDVHDVGNLDGGPGVLRVRRWGLINAEPPYLVHEIQAEIITQL